jgi:hypothetical protein
VPIGGGSPITVAAEQADFQQIAVDATSIYWTSSAGGSVMKATPK